MITSFECLTFEEHAQRQRNARAMRIALTGPVERSIEWHCDYCGFVARASTERALRAAFDAHWRYLNVHADRATDNHFEGWRLDALLDA